jgi:uncharacterized protein YceH (UPF0502 family)
MTLTPANTPLSATEARVLATLMEKARTVPDSYPLTLNTLLLGCNQKSSREPLMDLSEADIAAAIDSLKSAGLVRESSGGRTARFEHNAQRGIGVPEQSSVLLGLLMLRGPQTAAELRLNSERWYRFADVSSVEGFLDELQDRSVDKGGPLVIKLARAPGAREQRWAHLLCGLAAAQASAAPGARAGRDGGDDASTQARLERLEAEVAQLQLQVKHLLGELGLSPLGQP